MFVWTFRKGGLKKVCVVCACGVLLVAAAIGVNALRFREKDGEASQEAAAKLTQQMNSAEDLVTFLHGYGVEADVETSTVSTVTVPRKWDDSFKAFHAVIEQSGLTLKKCKGRQVDKWSLLVPAKSTEDSKTYAIVLVHENKPVGAYLLQKPSGEVQPLLCAAQTAAPLTEEEKLASASFGDAAETVTVTDGAADAAAVVDEEDTVIAGAAETGAAVQSAPAKDVAAGADAAPDEAAMPTD
ncbi:MAG: DUF4830 domain-containing protein [Ruthenibacterium sp.]